MHARALALALDPSNDARVAIQELRALANGDLSALSMAWMDLVEESFRKACPHVLQAEYLLHQAIVQEQHQPAPSAATHATAPQRVHGSGRTPVVA